MRAIETVQDLIQEAKIRAVWWAICIFGLAYVLSHTSKSTWANIPIAFLVFCLLRVISYEVDFYWKVRPARQQSYLSHLYQKQVHLDDPRLSTYPTTSNWKRKIDSPLVEAALDEFVNKILQDFVIDLWYSSITPDKTGPEYIRTIIYDALAEAAARIKEINLVELLTRDVVDLIGDHIDLYRRNQAAIGVDIMGTLSFEERDEKLKQHLMASNELHPALISSESEYKVLQRLMDGVLFIVLKSEESPLVRCIARELLVCLVMQPVMNFACPGYINELIECIFLAVKHSTDDEDTHSAAVGFSTGNPLKSEDRAQGTLDQLKGMESSYRRDHTKIPKNGVKAFGQDLQHPTANWARKLEAATERRTQVLAPENLDSLWSKGIDYSRKSGDQSTCRLPRKSSCEVSAVKKKSNPSGHIQYPSGQSSFDSCSVVFEMGKSGTSNTVGLERSNSSPALENEPLLHREAEGKTGGYVGLKDAYSMHSSLSGSLSVVRNLELSNAPKIKCRVLGACFEKIGSKSFAVYSIAVTGADNTTWFVKRRYRNFERLHRHLKDIPNYSLHLPPKRFLSSSIDDHFVHQRCVLLDKYLQDLLSLANVAEQHEVWDFLSASSKNYSFGKSTSVMKTLAVNVDDAVDDIVRQFKGVSDGFLRKVSGSSLSSPSAERNLALTWNEGEVNKENNCNFVGSSRSLTDDEGSVKERLREEISNGWHSDNELKPKRFTSYIGDSRDLLDEKRHQEIRSHQFVGVQTTSLLASNHLEDLVGVPSEWTPPNLSVPLLNLVDKIFQLNKRGWLRRQVFWISKQILQLMMEDAIDDWLLRQIHWLRRDDVVAQGILWVMDILWPNGTFFLNLEISSKDAIKSGDVASTKQALGDKVPRPGSFDAQLEAARRASDVKKMLFSGAPAALVSLIGQKQYRRCARDIYFFIQSTICLKQLAYCMLELILISVFPELHDFVQNIHENMLSAKAK